MNYMYNTVEVNHVPITWLSRDHESLLFIENETICIRTLHGSLTSLTFRIVTFYNVTVFRNVINGLNNSFSGKIELD